jgi:hypothetical protein
VRRGGRGTARPDYNFYHANFSPKGGHKLLGEATPCYIYWPAATARMHEYNPQLKVIVLLHNQRRPT